MKTIHLNKTTFLFSSTIGSDGNCKVCYVDNLYNALYLETQATVDKLKELLEAHDKLGFFCTFNEYGYKQSIEVLDEHFKRVYTVTVPIGYGGSQYHVFYIHPNKTSGGRISAPYVRRLEKEKCKLL